MKNREQVDKQKRLEAAEQIKADCENNISFFEERIAIQKKVDFNPVSVNTGARVRLYSQLDIDMEKVKLKKVDEVINNLK